MDRGHGRPAEVPLVVPDPSKYTIEFMSDWTFRATADCNTVSGTYRTVSAGRTGLPSTGLRLRPDPYSLAACGPDSLSDAFLQGLWSAARYEIADSQLTILRSTEGTMTFEVGGPVGEPTRGRRHGPGRMLEAASAPAPRFGHVAGEEAGASRPGLGSLTRRAQLQPLVEPQLRHL